MVLCVLLIQETAVSLFGTCMNILARLPVSLLAEVALSSYQMFIDMLMRCNAEVSLSSLLLAPGFGGQRLLPAA